MKGVIDRFEGNFAVVELNSGEMVDIEKIKIPKEAKEGDIINISDEISIDKNETLKRKDEIEKLTEGLWEE